jgi:LysM repeat protein
MEKFIITEEERSRIIDMHESASSRHYLNEQPKLSDLGKLPTGFMNAPEDVKKGFETGCYTVKSGDQLLAIAKKFGITLDDIMSLNGLTNGNIHPGQKLRVKNTTKFKGC